MFKKDPMSTSFKTIVLALSICPCFMWAGDKNPFTWVVNDHSFTINNKLKIEGLWGKNLRLLNSCNTTDEIFIPARHIWDFEMLYGYGKKTYAEDIIKVKTGIRNKGIWGAPASIARTGTASIKDAESVIGSHRHAIHVHVPIIREIWMEYNLNHMIGICPAHSHYFTLGLFPFQVGRGISLGNAYATTPDLIGYSADDAVQQFAPGCKLSGSLTDGLKYDLYAEIVDNKSESFDSVNEKIRGQEYGHKYNQARGYGVINYILAARIPYTKKFGDTCSINIEPYIVHGHDDEQRVEVLGDAIGRLTTLGMAFETTAGKLEAGFEMAFNFGSQLVRGLDRNVIVREVEEGGVGLTDGGYIRLYNDKVYTNTGLTTKAPYKVQKGSQDRINAVIPCSENNSTRNSDTSINANVIPASAVSDTPLYNALNRFRDPYQNTLEGSMALFDISYAIIPRIKVAGTIGFASGDANPNMDLDEIGDSQEDGNYKGFISLQETYSGKRVRSAFLMSGSGRIPRIASIPRDGLPGTYPSQVSQFTNLGFLGGALWLKPLICGHEFGVNPNILSYWQTYQTRIFDRKTCQFDPGHLAHPHLGVEGNVYFDTTLPHGVKLIFVGGVFVPGRYFADIKGVPLSSAEMKIFDRPDQTGITIDCAPTHGNSPAYFWNASIEYAF
ncbi:MAG: hypothetical protein UU47_C0001G0017 [candidate division TM6 bacterium GW2011_GWE2_41_16]|nr:MAG: hypothetical protein UU47_C0001G0017 [candidate division TM6 bacterium GW2011_GWE2_41_16]